MVQVMEGVDNEVILTFFILVGCFIFAAVYLKSRRTSRSFRQSNQQVQSNNCLTLETERNSNTNAEQGDNDGESRVGPSTSGPHDGINSDFNTDSLQGTNVGSDSNDINSYDTNIGPSTSGSSSYGSDLQQTASASNSHTSSSTEFGRRATIRVKYQETERSLTVDMSLKVGDLKRLCFPTEVSQGQTVHLVYSGRLLSNNNVPISYYGVGNHSVIHAQISAASPSNQSQHRQQQVDESDIDMGQIFLPLLMLILCVCWYGLITYRNIFSTMSTAILIVLTAAYALVVYAMMG